MMTAGARLTHREQDVLKSVAKHIKRWDIAPTRLELATELGISRPTVELHLQRIRDKGWLVLRKQWRGIFLRPEAAAFSGKMRKC